MKQTSELLISQQAYSDIVIGNTAIVRAMVETNVKVVTSYPGSPTPEIANAIKSIPFEKRPFYFEFSVNEKVATEVALGASLNGHTSCVFFKSVGLNVAADTFVQLSHFHLTGGMIIVLGDDPGANSSQNEQDNRHYAQLAYIPVYEPATPKEVYLMFKDAVHYTRKYNMPVIVRLTTHVCHAKEKINFSEWKQSNYDYQPKFNIQNGPYVAITKNALEMKRRALNKLNQFGNDTEKSEFHIMQSNANLNYGIITFGAAYLSLLDVLNYTSNSPDILKLGIIYPIPRKTIIEFLQTHNEVKIIEELDDLLEKEVKIIAYEEKLNCKIIGKQKIDDFIGEYTPDKMFEIIKNTWPEMTHEINKNHENKVPARPPQLCPGCGHRPVFTAIRKAISDDTITVGDIGCHTLGFLPPHQIGQLVVCMGHSTATGSGLSLFNNSRKVIAFIGDSTFYHAGIPAVINAVFNKHNLTLVILPNGTTGMTGHQDHPGSGYNFNAQTDAISIENILIALGVKNIYKTGAYNQQKVIEHIKKSMNDDSFSVVIAEHPCMLKKTREDKNSGTYKNHKINILQNECTKLMTCISKFGCPSFQIADDGKIWVHEDLCIGDGSCIQTCDAKAIKLKK